MKSKILTAEIINIGDELLKGKTVNTNAAYIADLLDKEGFITNRIVVIHDKTNDIVKELRDSLSRKPALIVTTGGLGPTHDDLTKRAVAKALGLRLVRSRELSEHIMLRHSGFHKFILDSKADYIIEGARVLYNEVGVAPAMLIEYKGVTILMLPGVREECKHLFDKFIRDYNKNTDYKSCSISLCIKDPDGYGEYLIKDIMKELYNKHKLYIKSKPKHEAGMRFIQLDISKISNNEQDTYKELESIRDRIIKEWKQMLIKIKG
ncbi:MAG: competence protein ComA [Candidatus Micrarchaeota archaeon]|nr:MAG: competence protein ComA [Candidatus Micrarchaeota archaeon]